MPRARAVMVGTWVPDRASARSKMKLFGTHRTGEAFDADARDTPCFRLRRSEGSSPKGALRASSRSCTQAAPGIVAPIHSEAMPVILTTGEEPDLVART